VTFEAIRRFIAALFSKRRNSGRIKRRMLLLR